MLSSGQVSTTATGDVRLRGVQIRSCDLYSCLLKGEADSQKVFQSRVIVEHSAMLQPVNDVFPNPVAFVAPADTRKAVSEWSDYGARDSTTRAVFTLALKPRRYQKGCVRVSIYGARDSTTRAVFTFSFEAPADTQKGCGQSGGLRSAR